MIRVAIADDHELIRGGLARLIAREDGILLVGEARTAAEAQRLLSETACDVLLLDVSLPDATELSALRSVKERHPDVPILMLSMHAEERYALRSLQNGAAGYVTKGRDSRVLISAIRKVATGGRYVSPDVAEQLAEAYARPVEGEPHDRLSERELEILLLIARGVPAGEIAEQLHLSPNTVQTYRRRILGKLTVKSNAELVRYTIDRGLFE